MRPERLPQLCNSPAPPPSFPPHVQVMHAQEAGAAAAIVYDNIYENLVIMSKPLGHPDTAIPAVFVSQHSGFILSKLLEVDGRLSVQIMPVGGESQAARG